MRDLRKPATRSYLRLQRHTIAWPLRDTRSTLQGRGMSARGFTRTARLLPAALALLLAGCGWVDSGVGGNAPPDVSAVQADYSVAAGGTLSVTAADGVLNKVSDGGNAPPTAKLVDGKGPAHAVAFALHPDGSFEYTHDGSASTSDGFTFVANDGIDDSAPVPVSIRILQPPQARDDTYDADFTPGSGVSLQLDAENGVLANDDSIDPNAQLQAELDTPAAIGSVQLAADGSFTYSEQLPGRDTFSYRATDGAARSDPATVTIRIRPVAEDDSDATRSGSAVDIDVLANDHDPDGALQPDGLAVVDAPAHGSARPASGHIRYTPADGFSGADSFRYTVTDDDGATSHPATVQVSVAANQAPQASPIPDQRTTVGASFALAAGGYFRDPEGDALHFSATGLPAGLAIDAASGAIGGTPQASGSYTVSVAASDGQASASSDFTLTVDAAALSPEQAPSAGPGASPPQPVTDGQQAPAEDTSPQDKPRKVKKEDKPRKAKKEDKTGKGPKEARRAREHGPGRGRGGEHGVALAWR